MSRVILVRHGDAVGTKGKFHGMKDDHLTRQGANEAVDAADTLKDLNLGAKKIYTSPLRRTKDTADIIADTLDLPVEERKSLYPWDLGNYVGRPVDEYLPDIKYYLAHPDTPVDGGEPFRRFAQRHLEFINRLLFDGKDDTHIVVTHGRNILLTKAAIKSGDNLNYDKNELINADKSTEHGGYAIADGNDRSFEIVTPKKSLKGAS